MPNVCTFGYSTVWWNWTRWEQYVDWMTLHGVNLPVHPLANEAILLQVHLLDDFVIDYFSMQDERNLF